METLKFTGSAEGRFPTLTDLMLLLKSELRLEILRCLVESPQSVTELVNVLELEQSAVSHSLTMLRQHGLVDSKRRKKQQIYRLGDIVTKRGDQSAVQITMACQHSEELTLHLRLRSEKKRKVVETPVGDPPAVAESQRQIGNE